jgi:hypothetical protein
MLSVETRSALIDFADILASTEVVNDTMPGAPWEEADGWEHTSLPANLFYNAQKRQGYVKGCLIQVQAQEDWGVYDYARRNGASKQVAAELSAAARRRALSQLVEWYRDGWEWFGVRCTYAVLGSTYHYAAWGIDDADYAESLRAEVAGEVAHQLEQAGYTVTGRHVLKHRRGNVNSQNWAA